MNNIPLKFAIKNVASEPPTGPIQSGDNGAGLISPEGTPYPMSGGNHDQWVERNREWLKQKYGFEISEEEIDNNLTNTHHLIHRLIEEKGWIKVRGRSIISRNPRSDRGKVAEAIQFKYLPVRDAYEIITPDYSYTNRIQINYNDLERELAQAKNKSRIKISSRDERVIAGHE